MAFFFEHLFLPFLVESRAFPLSRHQALSLDTLFHFCARPPSPVALRVLIESAVSFLFREETRDPHLL